MVIQVGKRRATDRGQSEADKPRSKGRWGRQAGYTTVMPAPINEPKHPVEAAVEAIDEASYRRFFRTTHVVMER